MLEADVPLSAPIAPWLYPYGRMVKRAAGVASISIGRMLAMVNRAI